MPDYAGRTFEILGFGTKGDVRIVVGSKTVFVSGVPRGFKEGDIIGITGYREGRGKADFASYAPLQTQQARPATGQPVTGREPAPSVAATGQQQVYILHIGPTSKGEDSAIAVVPPSVLEMKAYDALRHLIGQHDNKSVYVESTDRRIAGRLADILSRAQAERALEELVMTIGNEPVTPSSTKKLKDYFGKPEAGKYTAQAVVKEQEKDKGATEGKPAVASTRPPVQVARQSATVARKGSPGGLESSAGLEGYL